MPNPALQSQSAPRSEDRPNQTQENLKFLALLLITGGLFFWFISRINFPQAKRENSQLGQRENPSATPDDAKKSAEVTAADFGVLDPESVGLFLLKEVMEKREVIWSKWIKFAPAQHQREVFGTLPSWILSYLQDLGKAHKMDEKELAEFSLHDLFNEIALIEKSFKSPYQKHKAFLQWFRYRPCAMFLAPHNLPSAKIRNAHFGPFGLTLVISSEWMIYPLTKAWKSPALTKFKHALKSLCLCPLFLLIARAKMVRIWSCDGQL